MWKDYKGRIKGNITLYVALQTRPHSTTSACKSLLLLHEANPAEGRGVEDGPDYSAGKPCVYVGMTGLDPDTRFDKHKAGIQSNRYVQQFGLRLLPKLYEVYNPMPYDGARDMEVELAIGLREAGYGVWQA